MKQLTQTASLFFLRLSFRVLGWISPQRAAARAMKFMSTPRTFPARANEQAVLDQATRSQIPYRAGNLQTYRWGNGSRTVFLMHGWEGRAGNHYALIPQLVDSGWSVLAFDAPSHGQSDQQPTSMFDFADCLEMVLRQENVDAIVAHSFGCVATTIVLAQNQEFSVQKLVYIASPNRFEDRLQQMVDLFALSAPVTSQLRQQLRSATDYPIFDFSVSTLGDRIRAEERLLLHDRNDQLSLFQWSQDILDGWSDVQGSTTTLVPIEGTGHNRILWHEPAIWHIVEFLS